MFKHYLTLALRNLQKYRLQTIVSILGLAAGFICLSLSALWERYENTFNASIPNVERMYMNKNLEYGVLTPGGFALKASEMPEVEAVASFEVFDDDAKSMSDIFADEKSAVARVMTVDSTFFSMFGVKMLYGERPKTELEFAISESLAHQLFGNEDPVGKVVSQVYSRLAASFRVVGVYADMDVHTDICADAFAIMDDGPRQGNYKRYVFLLQPGKAVLESFAQKAYNHVEWTDTARMEPFPFADAHSYGVGSQGSLKAEHRRAFLLISLMLVVCSLANFLTLFLVRLRSRQREMALRLVHGATGRGLVMLFTTEVLIVLLSAVTLGIIGIVALKDAFAAYADIQVKGYVMSWSLLFMVIALAASLAICIVAVIIVKNATVSKSISTAHPSNHIFNTVGTGVQIAISLCFLFCVAVMMKQLHLLRDRDWGVAYKDVAALSFEGYHDNSEEPGLVDFKSHALHDIMEANNLIEEIRATPGVKEVMEYGYPFIRNGYAINGTNIRQGDDGDWIIGFEWMGVADPGSPVYGFTVLEGRLPRRDEWQEGEMILTESMVKELGFNDGAVGQIVQGSGWQATVICVIRDITWSAVHTDESTRSYYFLPLTSEENKKFVKTEIVSFTYEPSQRADVTRRIKAMMDKHPDMKWNLIFGTDRMAKMIESENNLMQLLRLIALVAFAIALFGIYSIITLACRQRRKEIAVRKVHGAKVGDILFLFIKEYGLILVISSAVAFVVGTLLMHRWLEDYINRTPMPWWLYVVIFVAVALFIALCVGTRVWKTAKENPADVVKSE